MIAGVEVLASKEVVAERTFSWPAFWVTLGVFLIGMTIFGLYLNYAKHIGTKFVIFCIILGLFVGAIAGAMAGGIFSETTEYETEYKVIIDDSVSMNEFLERYKIINQEGKIYTIREKK